MASRIRLWSKLNRRQLTREPHDSLPRGLFGVSRSKLLPGEVTVVVDLAPERVKTDVSVTVEASQEEVEP